MAAFTSLRNSIFCFAALGLLCSVSSVFGVAIADPENAPSPTVPPEMPGGAPAFPWGNITTLNGTSAVFIGDVANNNTYWVLSAGHSGETASFTFNGLTYGVLSSTLLTNPIGVSGTPDLRLFQIDATGLPSSLITLNLPSSLTDPSTPLYMVGAGGGIMRWGSNEADFYMGGGPSRVGVIPLDGYTTVSFGVQTDLENPTSPSEGYGIPGDSGGGILYLQDNEWYLAGIMFAVGDNRVNKDDPPGNIRYTYASNLAAYTPEILNIAAIAIPEPGTLILIGVGAAALLRIRRRSA